MPLQTTAFNTHARTHAHTHTHTHTHPFNGPLSRATQVSRYQKGKNNLHFTEARDSEWQWHQLDHMQFCTSLQTDNHATTRTLSFLQAGCPSCCPTNSVRALKKQALKAQALMAQTTAFKLEEKTVAHLNTFTCTISIPPSVYCKLTVIIIIQIPMLTMLPEVGLRHSLQAVQQ